MARLSACFVLLLVCLTVVHSKSLRQKRQDAAAALNPLAQLQAQITGQIQALGGFAQQLEQQYANAATQLGGLATGTATSASQTAVDAEGQLAHLAAEEVGTLVNEIEAAEKMAANAVAAEAQATGGSLGEAPAA